jgi:hypothetical protein
MISCTWCPLGVALGGRRRALCPSRVAAGRGARLARASGPLPGVSHFFIGDDQALWQRDVLGFAGARFSRIYRGVDVVYRSLAGHLEYAFEVAPGADPGAIVLHVDVDEGPLVGAARGAPRRPLATRLHIDDRGDLVISTPRGDVRHSRPVLHEIVGGERRRLPGGFVLRGPRDVGFRVEGHDRSRPLIIDPTVAFVGYLGGAGSDGGLAVASDRLGNTYVAGSQQIGPGQAFVRRLLSG